jgi:hypothetical protein
MEVAKPIEKPCVCLLSPSMLSNSSSIVKGH